MLTSSTSSLSDFVSRFLVNEADKSCTNLKKEIFSNFGSASDSERSLDELSNLRQRKGESISAYLERAHILSSTAFAEYGSEDQQKLAQALSVQHFTNGLISEHTSSSQVRC